MFVCMFEPERDSKLSRMCSREREGEREREFWFTNCRPPAPPIEIGAGRLCGAADRRPQTRYLFTVPRRQSKSGPADSTGPRIGRLYGAAERRPQNRHLFMVPRCQSKQKPGRPGRAPRAGPVLAPRSSSPHVHHHRRARSVNIEPQ